MSTNNIVPHVATHQREALASEVKREYNKVLVSGIKIGKPHLLLAAVNGALNWNTINGGFKLPHNELGALRALREDLERYRQDFERRGSGPGSLHPDDVGDQGKEYVALLSQGMWLLPRVVNSLRDEMEK